MPTDPKRDAQKVEDVGLTAQPMEAASTRNPGQDANDEAPTQPRPDVTTPPERRPRQDSLDRERASNEGMTAPPSKH